VRWVPRVDLPKLPFLEADIALVKRLSEEQAAPG